MVGKVQEDDEALVEISEHLVSDVMPGLLVRRWAPYPL